MHRNLTGGRMKKLKVLRVMAPIFAAAAPIQWNSKDAISIVARGIGRLTRSIFVTLG